MHRQFSIFDTPFASYRWWPICASLSSGKALNSGVPGFRKSLNKLDSLKILDFFLIRSEVFILESSLSRCIVISIEEIISLNNISSILELSHVPCFDCVLRTDGRVDQWHSLHFQRRSKCIFFHLKVRNDSLRVQLSGMMSKNVVFCIWSQISDCVYSSWVTARIKRYSHFDYNSAFETNSKSS